MNSTIMNFVQHVSLDNQKSIEYFKRNKEYPMIQEFIKYESFLTSSFNLFSLPIVNFHDIFCSYNSLVSSQQQCFLAPDIFFILIS